MGRLGIECSSCGSRDSFRIKKGLCQCYSCGSKFSDSDWEYREFKYIDESYNRAEINTDLEEALNSLDMWTRIIIKHRYGLYGRKALSQSEVSEMMSIHQSQVARCEEKGLKYLRKALN